MLLGLNFNINFNFLPKLSKTSKKPGSLTRSQCITPVTCHRGGTDGGRVTGDRCDSPLRPSDEKIFFPLEGDRGKKIISPRGGSEGVTPVTCHRAKVRARFEAARPQRGGRALAGGPLGHGNTNPGTRIAQRRRIPAWEAIQCFQVGKEQFWVCGKMVKKERCARRAQLRRGIQPPQHAVHTRLTRRTARGCPPLAQTSAVHSKNSRYLKKVEKNDLGLGDRLSPS